MHYKIEGAIRRNRTNFIICAILWVVLTIVFVSPFAYSSHVAGLSGQLDLGTFFVDNPSKYEDQLVILSFGDNKVVVNMALLHNDEISICKKPSSLKFENLYQEKEYEIKDFKYTPNLKRPICIIDPETTEEIKPTLYFDEKTKEVRGKCKLKPYKSYFAFEIRDKKDS